MVSVTTLGADLEERKRERAPEFLSNFGDTLVLEGMDCRLALSYVAYPQPDITWTFNGREIALPSDVYDVLAIGDEARLVIRAASRQLAGEFRWNSTTSSPTSSRGSSRGNSVCRT